MTTTTNTSTSLVTMLDPAVLTMWWHLSDDDNGRPSLEGLALDLAGGFAYVTDGFVVARAQLDVATLPETPVVVIPRDALLQIRAERLPGETIEIWHSEDGTWTAEYAAIGRKDPVTRELAIDLDDLTPSFPIDPVRSVFADLSTSGAIAHRMPILQAALLARVVATATDCGSTLLRFTPSATVLEPVRVEISLVGAYLTRLIDVVMMPMIETGGAA